MTHPRRTDYSARCDYAADQYGVPACIGRRVTVSGRPGIIIADRGHYIGVNFDCDKPGVIQNAHPTSDVVYGDMGDIRKMTRAQARYQRWLEIGDCFNSFVDFLHYESRREKEARYGVY